MAFISKTYIDGYHIGNSLPGYAGTISRIVKMKAGDYHVFGIGNFDEEPDSSTPYATVETGRLSTTTVKPTSGVYFEILRTITPIYSGGEINYDRYLVRVAAN